VKPRALFIIYNWDGQTLCSNPDFIRHKTSLTSEEPSFCSNISTMSSLQSSLTNHTHVYTRRIARRVYGRLWMIVICVLEQSRSSVKKKTIVIIAHLCSETAVFARIPTFRLPRSNRYSRTTHAVRS
jgi:hypothetical protein